MARNAASAFFKIPSWILGLNVWKT